MEISPVTVPARTVALSSESRAKLDYDNFLKLFIAQMKYQDPTEPVKASQQLAQLSVFSQVEQSITINSNLERLLNNSNLAQAASYIGKRITASDCVTGGTISSVEVTSTGLVARVGSDQPIPIKTGIKISK